MNGTKSIISSLTFWGVVVMMLPTLLGFFGIEISTADAQAAVNYVSAIIDVVITGGGGLLAIWGRLRARKRVTITGAPSQ